MSVYDVVNPKPVTTGTADQKYGFASLGQGDFLRLMTEQMKMQDPFAPVDNKEMLAQMAQFSQLAGVNDTNTNLQSTNSALKTISDKLDALIAAQQAAGTL
jgi:flagellar basal-body rod modification protein FlgD